MLLPAGRTGVAAMHGGSAGPPGARLPDVHNMCSTSVGVFLAVAVVVFWWWLVNGGGVGVSVVVFQ